LPAERIDLELDAAAVRPADFLFLQIDADDGVGARTASSSSLSISACGRAMGRMPFLKQLL